MEMKKTLLCELLGIEYPVIQAPMNWITGAELAGAVSDAGGLGVIGPNAGERTQTNDVVETGERLRRQIRKVKSMTDKPFGVNLMTFFADHADSSKAFSDQCLQVILEERVPVAVLAGSGPKEYTERLKKEQVKVLFRPLQPNIVTAREAEEAGVDALIAVGFEAGGHAGYDRIPTLVLIPQIVDAVQIPVVAGGGIVDGRGMAAALALGAQGIFMGTRFVATTECSAHQNVKKAIVDAGDTSTVTVTGTVGVLRALEESSHGALHPVGGQWRQPAGDVKPLSSGICDRDGAGEYCGRDLCLRCRSRPDKGNKGCGRSSTGYSQRSRADHRCSPEGLHLTRSVDGLTCACFSKRH